MEHNYDVMYEANGVEVIECKDCGYIHFKNKPTKEELDDFYSKMYWEIEENLKLKANYTDATSILTDEEILNDKKFNEMFNIFEKLIDKKSSNKRMLSIGCGPTLITHFFALKGYETLYIEPSDHAVELLDKYNLKGFKSSFEDFDFESIGTFDFIDISFVLEHISEPRELIENARKCLNKGGVMKLAIPNDFSPTHLAYLSKENSKPEWITYPDHINYFNFKSFKNLIEKVGLKELYRTTNFPLDLLLNQGYDYYKNPELKNNISKIVSDFESSFEKLGKLEEYYENLASQDLGRWVIMYVGHE